MAERDRRRYADGPAAQRPSTPTADAERGLEELVLPLQRSAGNHAVGAMIAARGTLARQTGAPPTADPGQQSKEAGGGAAHVTFDAGGTVGEFDALSVQFGQQKPGALGGKKPKDEKEKVVGDVHVTKQSDEHTATLQRLTAEGRPLSVEIRIGPMTLRIKDALISNFTSGGGGQGRPVDSLTFNGTIESEFQPEPDAGGTPSS